MQRSMGRIKHCKPPSSRVPLSPRSDPARLSQVISNLLLNASKFAEPGGAIRLDIMREGRDLILIVGDDGAGLAEEDMPRVFEPFYQVSDGREVGGGGLGIGLALVPRSLRCMAARC